ncbi:hypothetical protein LTR36_005503 [Oleoguttula mirabilis]|uniref:Uncharacterized protein n=1 Tax=Oleoguttula mirabilis TaxID=1507867 RepID=A0AAV9JDJ6_9PEZI|nr:hypothetical protein LTR36_005503 [Oleoguttula mirabilis]
MAKYRRAPRRFAKITEISDSDTDLELDKGPLSGTHFRLVTRRPAYDLVGTDSESDVEDEPPDIIPDNDRDSDAEYDAESELEGASDGEPEDTLVAEIAELDRLGGFTLLAPRAKRGTTAAAYRGTEPIHESETGRHAPAATRKRGATTDGITPDEATDGETSDS